MEQRNAISALHYEFTYPLLSAAKVPLENTGHWSEQAAAERLEQDTREQPENVAAWTALGERRLYIGNFIGAVHAFDHAHALQPESAAILLRRAEALATLDPAGRDRDIATAVALGASLPPSPPALAIAKPAPDDQVATIYSDMTDMMAYIAHNTTFSGIQRVVGNILRQVQLRASPNSRNIIPVLPDYHRKIVYAADINLFYELIDTIERGEATREHLDRLLTAIRASLRTIRPEPGSIFLLAGAFWILDVYDLFRDLRLGGVHVTVFVHDLIQINYPQFVSPGANQDFRRSFIDMGELGSFFTTNSVFVASEVRRFLADEMELETLVHPVPLATEMSLVPPEPLEDAALLAEFGAAGYVLCVCTIEIRKNHIYLLRVWQELLNSNPDIVPTLIFVGKWGWEVEELQEALEMAEYLDGKIKVMSGLSDTTLANLYRNCRFTVYPSFAEGWGLPIGESLAFGRPCIASGVTSMPEVGGDLVRYVDPYDVADGLAAVRAVIENPDDLVAWTDRVRADFATRTWTEFTEHLLGATRAMAAMAKEAPKAFARLRPGELAVLGHTDVVESAASGRTMRTARMSRQEGWSSLDHTGSWSRKSVARLLFYAEGCAPGTPVRVILALRGENPGNRVCLISGDHRTPERSLLREHQLYSCPAVIDEDGIVTLAIQVIGDPVKEGERDLYAHLSHLGFYRPGSPEETLQLMEACTFER